MPLYRDEAVVLRTQKLGEADRIVTLLTRRHGRVRAVAKGVRRTGSQFGSRVEPFSHVDLQLYEGRSLDTVTQAETLEPYGERIAADYGRYTAGTAMLETAERLRPRSASRRSGCTCWWWARCARWPSRSTRRPSCSTRSSCGRWRSPGYEPVLDGCARSAATPGPHRYFARRAGRPGLQRAPPAGSRRPCRLPALGPDGRAAERRLGRRRRRRGPGASARPAGWSRRTCSGTSNVGCARCGSSSGYEVPQPVRSAEPGRGRRLRTPPAPARPRSRPRWCRATSRSSWTATAGGPSSAACPGPSGTSRARARCSTSSRARSRSA